MAVRASTAGEREASGSRASGPVRTCIGCRWRSAAAELLRVVVAPEATDTAGSAHCAGGPGVAVVADPRHRVPGRGAWLHLDLRCVDLAERRRSFARALRVSAAADPAPVRQYVRDHPAQPLGDIAGGASRE